MGNMYLTVYKQKIIKSTSHLTCACISEHCSFHSVKVPMMSMNVNNLFVTSYILPFILFLAFPMPFLLIPCLSCTNLFPSSLSLRINLFHLLWKKNALQFFPFLHFADPALHIFFYVRLFSHTLPPIEKF